MAEKKRTLWAIDLNGSPLNQFSGNEFEIYEDTDGKINIAVDKKIINAESIENWNEGGGGGTEVIANPELEGNEDALTGLEVDGTKYKVDASNYSKEYEGQDVTYKDERLTSTAYNRLTTTSTIEANENDGNGAVIETNTSTQPAWGEITTEVKLVDVEGEVYEGASITMEAHVDGETGDPSSSIDIKGNENGVGAQINIGGENDTVNINGQPYSPGTEVIANPTLAGTEANLTGLQVGNNKYKVPQGGGASVDSTPLFSGQLDFSTDNVILPTVTSYNYPEVNMEDVNNWINWLGFPLERMVIKVDVYKPTDTWVAVPIPIDAVGETSISIMVPLGEAVQVHRFGTGGSEGDGEWAHCMRLRHRFNAGFYNRGTPWELGDCAYSGDLSEFNFELSYPSSFSEIEHICSIFGAGTPLGKTVTYPNMDNNWYSYTVVLGQDANSNECSCYHQGNIQEHPAPENGEE